MASVTSEPRPGEDPEGSGGDSGRYGGVDANMGMAELLGGYRGRPPPGLLRELVFTALASVANAGMVVQKVRLIGYLAWATSNGNGGMWLRSMIAYPVVIFATSGINEAFGLCRRRLALEWRRELTHRIHAMYFSNMAYYRLLNHERFAVGDPDIRISKEMQSMCEAYSNVAVHLTTSVITTLLYGTQGRLPGRSWRWMLVGPLFPAASQVLLDFLRLCFVSRDWAFHCNQVANSRYEQATARLELHKGRVCALQGEPFELDLLEACRQKCRHWGVQFAEALRTHEFAGMVVSGGGAYGLFSVACYLPAALIRINQIQGRGEEASAAAAQDFGEWYADSWYFLSIMGQWGSFFGVVTSLEGIRHAVHRIADFVARLRALEQDAGRFSGSLEDLGPTIAFRDVAVRTPTGQLLLEHLDFQVPQGQPLLITGHNGAGKSSIIRCLCCLWPVASGTIARPGGAAQEESGSRQEVYYLPQKPVSPMGSLSDQLTYPAKTTLSEAELRRWLSYVDLEHLVDRHPDGQPRKGARGDEDWENVLSLGEQQALSLARLLYHRPRFAVLDECTSAVSRQLERRLFEVCRGLGITCVTITHRPTLQEFHGRVLRLTGAKDGKGWRLESLPHRKALERGAPAFCDDEKAAHNRIAEFLPKERGKVGAPPAVQEKPPTARQDEPCSLGRAAAVIKLADPQELLPAAWGHVAWMTCTTAICFSLSWEAWIAVMSMTRAALNGDVRGVAVEAFSSMLLVPSIAVSEAQYNVSKRHLLNDLCSSVVSALHRRALSGEALLKLTVDAPVQRIPEAKSAVNDLMELALAVVRSVAKGLWFLPSLLSGGGTLPLVGLGAHAAVSLCAMHFAPDWRSFAKRSQALETRFQSLHARVRHAAEAVAFSHGGGAERRVIERHFDVLCEHEHMVIGKEFLHAWLSSVFKSYDMIPLVVRRSISHNFSARNNPAFGNPDVAAVPRIVVTSLPFEQIVNQIQGMFGQLVDLVETWPRLAGRLTRVLELMDALDEVAVPGPRALASSADAIEVKDLDLITAQGDCLARGVSFELRSGSPVLVSGPNASGKSLLGACLLGLRNEASVAFPCCEGGRPPLTVLMGATQRVYLPSGTLGDQVCYPKRYLGGDELAMDVAMKAAGVKSLLDREPRKWLARRVWEDVLSGGEQQRLCLARIFFRRPRFAVLDECTSMVASAEEEGLYYALVRIFGITPATLTQRLFLGDLHPLEVRLGSPSQEGWALVKTKEAQEPAAAAQSASPPSHAPAATSGSLRSALGRLF